ncbi:MAG: hypothetical protein ABI856_19470 [Nitrospira sp.]
MDGIGTNVVTKRETVMATVNEVSRIEANVEAVTDFLKNEFELCSMVQQANGPLTHTFTVENRKKLLKLTIGWPILADSRLTRARLEHALKDHVAEQMRLHGVAGYQWTPTHEDMTSPGGI